jgi:protein O-GlcNAc transferase
LAIFLQNRDSIDTFIYNAGATAVASLQAGLPLLTKVGNKYVNRMGASICAAAGLESMICETVEEYQQKAIALANNPQKLQEIKDYLKSQKLQLPLFDLPQFVSSLEEAYFKIVSDT